jgi:hypothetical protein
MSFHRDGRRGERSIHERGDLSRSVLPRPAFLLSQDGVHNTKDFTSFLSYNHRRGEVVGKRLSPGLAFLRLRSEDHGLPSNIHLVLTSQGYRCTPTHQTWLPTKRPSRRRTITPGLPRPRRLPTERRERSRASPPTLRCE